MTDNEQPNEQPEPEQQPDEVDSDEVESHDPIEGPRPDDAVEYEGNQVGEHMNKDGD